MSNGSTVGPAAGFAVRPATVADSQAAASLIYLTMGPLADHLFGAGDHARAIGVISALFAQDHNRFSYRFADVAVAADSPAAVGLVISYPGRMLGPLATTMAKQLFAMYGVTGFVSFVTRALPLVDVREARPDEYFINTLAVSPDAQGQGIGTQVLSFAEQKARDAHCRDCALSVDEMNVGARRLYERLGYRVVATIGPRRPRCSRGHTGYHRMVKAL